MNSDGVSKPSILVVDDNPANLKYMRILLVSEGYLVHVAVDAEDALLMLQEMKPALILTDLHMPGASGVTLIKRLKADPTTRNIPILALTASDPNGEETRAAMNAGATAYYFKPIHTGGFLKTVAALLLRKS